MTDETQARITLRSVALIVVGVAVVGAFAVIAAGPAAAEHEDHSGDYTVVLPHNSDHLPGDQNEENASMQNFAQSGDAMRDAGAPNGFETLDYLETGSQEIDYSNCGSANTAVFGVDRGNNNSGTKTDTDLLKHMKESRFKEHKIEVEFYEDSDLGGNPTYLNPEDAIVSVQGAGSSGGPCFTMPTEPGWYQTSGMIRGTNEDGETVEVSSKSHYIPICEGCHDEATAEEKLGPKPSADGGDGGSGDESTPTPTPTSTAEDDSGGDGDATATPTADDSTDDTTDDSTDDTTDDTTNDSDGSEDDGGEQTSDDQSTDEQDGGAEQNDTGGNGSAGESDATPTPGGGPGFGPIVALIALLATTFLLQRRD